VFQDRASQRVVYNSRMIGTIQITFGGILSFLFGLASLSCFADLFNPDRSTSFGSFLIIFIVFSISLYILIRGIQRIHFTGIYGYYMRFLYQEPSHSIEQLAGMLHTPAPAVRSNLERMIRKGFLAYAYIDDAANRIVCTMNDQAPPLQGFVNTPVTNPNPVWQSRTQRPVELVTVTCPNCGASGKMVKGTVTECEYCGSSIVAK
jgi:hypothetical protein